MNPYQRLAQQVDSRLQGKMGVRKEVYHEVLSALYAADKR